MTSLIRRTNQRTFLDIWNNYTTFKSDYDDLNEFNITLDEAYLKKTFFLLVARYGDQAITGYRDEPRWKLRVFATIATYGPVWQEKSKLQETIRGMTVDDFKKSSKTIYNTALNPNSVPTTGSLEELEYINSQNTSNKVVSDYEAIARKWELLNDDLDKNYTDHFKGLFSKFLLQDVPLYVYANEQEDETNE